MGRRDGDADPQGDVDVADGGDDDGTSGRGAGDHLHRADHPSLPAAACPEGVGVSAESGLVAVGAW